MDPSQVTESTHADLSSPRAVPENVLSGASETSTNTPTADLGLGLHSQVVLILVGLIGSGKSTFAQALQEHYPEFRRCNQDELGDRRAVEDLSRRSLREGSSVCIDRTNIDARQRSTWISIAHETPGAEVWVLLFDTPFKVCEERLLIRENHPTITTPAKALEILQRFRTQYQIPRPSEGYDRELRLTVDEQQLNYTAEDVLAILRRLQASPKIDSQPGRWSHQNNFNSYRGQSSYRGYTNYRGSPNYRGSSSPRGSFNSRGYSGYRGSSNYAGGSYYHGPPASSRGRGGSSTPYLRDNGSFNHSRANDSHSSTYLTGGSMNKGEGSAMSKKDEDGSDKGGEDRAIKT